MLSAAAGCCVKGAPAGYTHVLTQTEAKAQRFNHDNMLTQRTQANKFRIMSQSSEAKRSEVMRLC